MRFRIRTWVLGGFALLTLLLAMVGVVAVDRTERVATLARDLNGRVVDKARIAADIVSLARQLRFVDAFVLQVASAEQALVVRQALEKAATSFDAEIASYRQFVESDLERSLLANLEKSKAAYLALETRVLDRFSADRSHDFGEAEARLGAGFDPVARQVKGLATLAESQARAERAEASAMTDFARWLVLTVTGAATAIAVFVVLLLRGTVFRPLEAITRSLVALARGELDIALPRSARDDEIDDLVRALGVFRQNAVTLQSAHAEIKAAQERAEALARHDALTGLPNRRVLADAIECAMSRSARRKARCAVLLLDLVRFKPVNDVYGHAAGDRVLCEVARRLAAAMRAGETAARLGGDEFAVVIDFEAGSDVPMKVAKRLAASIAEPMEIDGRTIIVGASIGIALWPTDGETADALLRAADLAMFKAKREGQAAFRFYEPDMDVQVRERAGLESRVREAIRNGDIRPHYQPLVDLATNRVTGLEVLARWQDGERLRPPGEFIPLVEEAGLIGDLTQAMLRQACRDCRPWPDVTLAINITPAQIGERRLPGILLGILRDEGIAPSRLEIEVTENALIGDVSCAKAVIEELRGHGVKVSLDDFGTGYSSLHHLRDLKFDKIKIDRSFVQTMSVNPESAKIVETVLGLSRSLGMAAVAEGIECEEHLQSLRLYGCQFGQGYLLGKPLSAAATAALLDHRDAAAPALDEAA